MPGAGAALPAMTLPEALSYAARHQPSLLAAQARVRAAQRDADVPRGLWGPRLGATLQALAGTANNSTASYVATPVLDLPRIGGTRQAPPHDWQPYPSSLAGIGVRQEVFDFGRIGALEAAFDATALAEGAHGEADRLDVALTVEEAYFAVHAAKGVLRAAQKAEQRARMHRELAAAGVRSGLRSPIELTRAEADLSRFAVASVRAAGGLDVARVVFAAAVGVPEARLDADGEPGPPAAAPPDSTIAGAADRDPLVREATARLHAQRAFTRVAEAELRPDLFLSAGINVRAGGATAAGAQGPWGNGFVPDVPNWDAALVLSWPIYDRTSIARANASRVREEQRRAELDLVRQRLAATVQQALAAYEVAGQAVPALEQSLQAASRNHAQADARFKAGLGSSVELADAEALLVQAEIDLAVGRFEHARARARLGHALSEEP
jgi:outer membrane protein TolC